MIPIVGFVILVLVIVVRGDGWHSYPPTRAAQAGFYAQYAQTGSGEIYNRGLTRAVKTTGQTMVLNDNYVSFASGDLLYNDNGYWDSSQPTRFTNTASYTQQWFVSIEITQCVVGSASGFPVFWQYSVDGSMYLTNDYRTSVNATGVSGVVNVASGAYFRLNLYAFTAGVVIPANACGAIVVSIKSIGPTNSLYRSYPVVASDYALLPKCIDSVGRGPYPLQSVVYLSKTTNQFVTSGAYRLITWVSGNVVVNTNGYWSSGSTDRITNTSGTRKYWLVNWLIPNGVPLSALLGAVFKNGGATASLRFCQQHVQNTMYRTSATCMIQMESNDYIELYGWTGANANLPAGVGPLVFGVSEF